MEVAIPKGLTVFDFPESHRRRIRTSNMLERVNQEIKRRAHFIDKAENPHCILVTQPRAFVTEHPFKGSQKVRFTLNVYWRKEPPSTERTAILLNDQTSRVVPKNAA